jgi:tetratricopeptide (TPR) repeat protein
MRKTKWLLQLSLLMLLNPQSALASDNWDQYNSAGVNALRDQKYPEAEKQLLKAKAEAEESGGPKYGNLSTTLLSLGLLYDKQNKIAESDKTYKLALSYYEKSFGDKVLQDGNCLQGLGDLYRHHNRYDEALPYYQRALKIREVLIPEHTDTADTLWAIADIYTKQGKKTETAPVLSRCLSIRQKALGNNHPKTAKVLEHLCEAYIAQGKYQMAQPLADQLVEARMASLGTTDPKVADALEILANCYEKIAKPNKSDANYKKALAIREKFGKENPAALANCLKSYSALLKGMGEQGEAAKLETRIASLGKTTKADPKAAAPKKSGK